MRRNRGRRALAALLGATLLLAAPGAAVTAAPPASGSTAGTPPPIAGRLARTVGPGVLTLTADLRRSLDQRLEGLRTKYAIPGISVAIIFPDGETWLGVGGSADLDGGRPVTPDTAFAAASITKTFTSAQTMALIQDGLLALDAPVRTYLPDLELDPTITVRQLLDHTSGLRDYFEHGKIDAALLGDTARRWDEGEALGYVGKPYFKPGRGWHYSNTNYLILGLLAERIGGKPLADQFRARFLGPLGLAHTYYQPTEGPLGPVAHGYRFATSAKDAPAVDLSDGSPMAPFTSVVTAAAGAGGMATTAGDLARWARALYAGRALEDSSVVTMVGDVALTERFKPTLPYGLGVQAIDVGGRPSLGHSGRLLGFRSLVRWFPEDAVTVAVLTNQSRSDPALVAGALLALALGPTTGCACVGVR